MERNIKWKTMPSHNTTSAFNTSQPKFSDSKHLKNAKPRPPSLGKGAQPHSMLWYSNSHIYSDSLQTEISQPHPRFSRDLWQLVKLSQIDAIHSLPQAPGQVILLLRESNSSESIWFFAVYFLFFAIHPASCISPFIYWVTLTHSFHPSKVMTFSSVFYLSYFNLIFHGTAGSEW